MTQLEAAYDQLLDGPRWAGNLVSKTGTRELVELGVVVYDSMAQDPELGYGSKQFMVPPGAYRLVSTVC